MIEWGCWQFCVVGEIVLWVILLIIMDVLDFVDFWCRNDYGWILNFCVGGMLFILVVLDFEVKDGLIIGGFEFVIGVLEDYVS